jgi:hypothetical protein
MAASTHGPYQVTAWHRQFYLLDPDQPGDTASLAFWTQEAFDSRLAVQPGVLGIGTDTNGEVPVTVEVFDAEPTTSLNGWDHVAEASLELSTRHLSIAGCPDMDVPIATISLGPGWFRVRIYSAGLSDQPPEVEYSGDSYLAQVWPSVPGERTVIKKFPFQPKNHEN